MSAILKIEKTWQNWITINLKKNVPVRDIAITLADKGMLDAAVELLKVHNIKVAFPRIDFSKNHISLPDKEVSLLFTSTQPTVAVIDNFLSIDECQELIRSADSQLKESRVVNPEDGSFVQHDARTSTSTAFQRGEVPIVSTVESRISALINWPVENGEGLQLLRYEDGGEYRPHYDYFDPAKKSSAVVTKKGGQRVGTFLMYLSDVDVGGSTAFPEMNFQVRPKMGMALYFANTKVDGRIDKQTLHAGLPVTSGVKYLATKWLREKAYV